MELNILYLVKILANRIGHKSSQQLQFTTNYIHNINRIYRVVVFNGTFSTSKKCLQKVNKGGRVETCMSE